MNAAEKLAWEIRRVTLLRCNYAMVGANDKSVNVKPAMALMDLALDQACEAAGSNDAQTVIAALAALQGFEK